MHSDDLELFQKSIRDATNDQTGEALDIAIENVGWRDAMAIEPRVAISTLFQLQGDRNVTSSALDHVVRCALGLTAIPARGIVFPALGQWNPPGTVNSRGLQVGGLASAACGGLESVVVFAATERGETAFAVPTASLILDSIGGIDPSLGLRRVTGEDIGTYADLGSTSADWTSAVAMARLAIGHELVGVSRKMLELARQHALGRVQFGLPISSFQAIRHRLAETLVAIEMADAMLDSAWLDGTSHTAAMAKAVAGRQARTSARHCQQVLAGIGFTTEHPFHLYVRRALVLDGLFGTSASLTRALGQEMIETAQLPAVLPL
jgi:hypothetical protein